MNEWMNEWEFIILGAYCCWCLLGCSQRSVVGVLSLQKYNFAYTTHIYDIMQHYTAHMLGEVRWGGLGAGKKFRLSNQYLYDVYMCDTHTHTHTRNEWMSSNDCVGKSFPTQKLCAHLNYKLDYESCDWISDVIVIMYSFRKMCV